MERSCREKKGLLLNAFIRQTVEKDCNKYNINILVFTEVVKFMKRIYKEDFKEDFNNEIFGMANLMPQRTGLSVNIWSDNNGVSRNKVDKTPRVKIGYGDVEISVSISPNPEILAKSHVKQSDWKYLNEGIKYIARNYDLFLRHYNNIDGTFDDRDLINELEKRGDYK